jgi:hypothetical protein
MPRLKKLVEKDIERAFSVLQSQVCNCSWTSSFLGDKVSPKYHEGMCDSAQHDHQGRGGQEP